MNQIIVEQPVVLHLGNEVRRGNVDEVSRGKGQQQLEGFVALSADYIRYIRGASPGRLR
jgi:hypothetical protein